MLTSTDIPPGGEGQIEVTFDTSHKNGKERKAITVESNDPVTPSASLYVTATIEVLLAFDQYVIDLDRVPRGQEVKLATTLLMKDSLRGKKITFGSTSPFIRVALTNESGASPAGPGRLDAVVTVSPEMPAGKINVNLSATVDDPDVPPATAQVQGKVIGNLNVEPDIIQFHLDTTKSVNMPGPRVVKVTATNETVPVRLLKVEDMNQRIQIQVDTLSADREYQISIRPRQAVLDGRLNLAGTLKITTDDREEPVTEVTYFISFGS